MREKRGRVSEGGKAHSRREAWLVQVSARVLGLRAVRTSRMRLDELVLQDAKCQRRWHVPPVERHLSRALQS